MKILITTDLYLPSVNGVVNSVMELTRELTAKGHEIRTVTLSSSIHSRREGNVTYIGSVSADAIYPEVRLRSRTARELIGEIIEWCPDVIHSQCEFSTFTVAKKVAKATGAPIVHTYHTVYEDYSHYFMPSVTLAHYAVSGFTKTISKHVDCMIAPTNKIRDLLSSYHIRSELAVVPSGIDLSIFQRERTKEEIKALKDSLKIPENHRVLVNVGRIAKEKNLTELIYTLSRLNMSDITLVLVGDGPFRQELEESAKKIPFNVVFAGMIPHSEIDIYYKMGDVFVSASTSETQGLTYDEALACGLPCICKRDACLDGVIINEYNGWQFESGKEFYSTLQKILSSKELLEKMSENAKISAEKFSSKAFAESVEGIYLRMIAKKGSTNR